MTGTQIFDRLALDESCSPATASDADDLIRLAEQMVSTAITSWEMLSGLRPRMFPATREPRGVGIAEASRAEFDRWAKDAEEAYTRACGLERAGSPVTGTRKLGDLLGITRAMLQVTIESHFRAIEQVARGEFISAAELRHELQHRRRE